MSLFSLKNQWGNAVGIFITYAVLFLSFVLLTSADVLLAQISIFLMIGLMQYRLVVSCHEASHGTLFTYRQVNDFFGLVHASLTGINLERYSQQHMAHHRAAKINQDPDAYIYKSIIQSPPGLRRFFVLVVGIAAELIEKIKQKGGFISSGPAMDKKKERQCNVVLVLLNALLFLVLLIYFSWWVYFVFWIAPIFVVAIFMNRVRVFIEHGYLCLVNKDDAEVADLNTIDIRSNGFEKFFLAPFNFNFHYCHHYTPQSPSYFLSDVHSQLVEKEGREFMIDSSYMAVLMWMLKH